MTKIKDAYAYVIDGVSAHPHVTVWVAAGLIALALVA